MSLSAVDLHAFAEIVDQSVTRGMQPLQEGMQELQQQVQGLKEDVSNVKEDVQNLKTAVQNLNADVEGLKENMDSMQNRMQQMEDKILDMDSRFKEFKLHVENVTDRNIQMLVENYVPAAIEYQRRGEQIDAMQEDVNLLKKVVREHSDKLNKIA